MSQYLKNPLVVFCIVAVICYGSFTYYNNNKCTDEKKKFTQNDIYMYSVGIALIMTGIVYLMYNKEKTETSNTQSDIIEEPLQNRPVLNKNQEFFESVPKITKKMNKGTEKIMTEPFDK